MWQMVCQKCQVVATRLLQGHCCSILLKKLLMGFLGCTNVAWVLSHNTPSSQAALHCAQAPAVSLAEHSEALREELGSGMDRPQLSTDVLGCQRKNASRQYKRAVTRFGMELNLGFSSNTLLHMLSSNRLFCSRMYALSWVHFCLALASLNERWPNDQPTKENSNIQSRV